MSTLLSPLQHDAARPSPWVWPMALVLASGLAASNASAHRALITHAVAWCVVCVFAVVSSGDVRALFNGSWSQRCAWAAGALLALGTVCERAVEARGIWWAKALLPLLTFALVQAGILSEPISSSESTSPSSPVKANAERKRPISHTVTLLLVLASSGLVALSSTDATVANVALGFSYVVLQTSAIYLVARSGEGVQEEGYKDGSVYPYAADGTSIPLKQGSRFPEDALLHLLRDVSCMAALMTGCLALVFELPQFTFVKYHTPYDANLAGQGLLGRVIVSGVVTAGTVLAHSLYCGLLVTNIQWHGFFRTAFSPLLANLCVLSLAVPSLSRAWFATLSALAALLIFSEDLETANSITTKVKTRPWKLLTCIAVVSLILRAVVTTLPRAVPPEVVPFAGETLDYTLPPTALGPLMPTDDLVHPIQQLVKTARTEWSTTLQSQSRDLAAAVTEYRRRYGIAPPPHFDVWFRFARERGVQMLDDYDSIYHSLLPFWGLSPATIRARAREAIGFADNQLLGLLVRNGQVALLEGGPEWLQQAIHGMLQSFVGKLPDMDLAFNLHDEPRVVVPHDSLSRLIQKGLDERLGASAAKAKQRNTFSPRPDDMNDGRRIREVKRSRFNVFAHQPTWNPSRLSCPPDSPAQTLLDDALASDNLTSYAFGNLGFIYNQTAFSDVCNSPSLAESHGFFERANAFNVISELFPIFSQSKMSSFQDILYPSPWYWNGNVSYLEDQDMTWAQKNNSLWWRGSTTGGFSRSGGWRRQHRQRLVKTINTPDPAAVLHRPDPASPWQPAHLPHASLAQTLDVHFSGLGQCDPGDCDAQREAFHLAEPAAQQAAWQYKYLLDLDGNAFSGRFYAFLNSSSVALKMAVFREWHAEWLRPWVHYIPLSLRGTEVKEVVRYLDQEDEGREFAVQMARESQLWARKALRNADLEVWFFRLLLEYARVIDDRRAEIGFDVD